MQTDVVVVVVEVGSKLSYIYTMQCLHQGFSILLG